MHRARLIVSRRVTLSLEGKACCVTALGLIPDIQKLRFDVGWVAIPVANGNQNQSFADSAGQPKAVAEKKLSDFFPGRRLCNQPSGKFA